MLGSLEHLSDDYVDAHARLSKERMLQWVRNILANEKKAVPEANEATQNKKQVNQHTTTTRNNTKERSGGENGMAREGKAWMGWDGKRSR